MFVGNNAGNMLTKPTNCVWMGPQIRHNMGFVYQEIRRYYHWI